MMHANNAGFLCQIKCNLLYHRSVDARGQQFAFHEYMRHWHQIMMSEASLLIYNMQKKNTTTFFFLILINDI